MSLVVNDLRDDIISATDYIEGDVASDYLGRMETAISDYIKNNVVVSFAWVAALPAPPNTPDPITTANGEIITLSFTLTPASEATEQSAAILDLKTKFIAGLTSATYNITDAGFTTTPGAMSTSPSLSLLTIDISGDNRIAAMGDLASDIVDWVAAQLPTGPCAGTRIGTYTGAGTPTGIA